MKQTKCEILDCVLNIFSPSLKAEAKRICDLTRDDDRIWINDKEEVILDGRVVPKSNIFTLIIEELMKCAVNTKQYETEDEDENDANENKDCEMEEDGTEEEDEDFG